MAEPDKPITIQYHYIKSNGFRVVHADGVFGGPTPRGYMHLAFFSERAPLPTLIEQEVIPEGGTSARLGAEVKRVVREGFVREIEVDVIMDLAMAKSLHSWLAEHLEKVDAVMAAGAGESEGHGAE